MRKIFTVFSLSLILIFSSMFLVNANESIKGPEDIDGYEEVKPIESIQSKLNRKSEEFSKKIDESTKESFAIGLQKIKDSGVLERALKKGDKAPDFELKSPDGEIYRLYDILANGPVVLTWYRGGWCPYCNIYLKGLRDAAHEIEARGATLVAISPEQPEKGQETAIENKIPFILLSDINNEAGKKFNIVFKQPEIILAKFVNYGINLTEYNGNGDNELPLSATYVIGRKGKILYSFLDIDYKKRAEPKEIISVLDLIEE